MAGATSAFDSLAARYDEVWTNSPVGRLQRDAVWRNTGNLFPPQTRVLDFGCGTGEDAAWLTSLGVRVTAIDASQEMVRVARLRGIDAKWVTIDRIEGSFDGVLSNFGPVNCIEAPEALRSHLARLVRPGGHVALCVMGRFCLWETIGYLLRGLPRRAARRWTGSAASDSLGIRVNYPSIRKLRRALAPEFVLLRSIGIGIFVPPSFIRGIPGSVLRWLAAIDRVVEGIPGLRAFSDHRLLILVRQ